MPLQTERERLRQIMDAVPSLIAYVTAEQRYAMANRAYLEWFAIESERLIGRTLRENLGDETYARLQPHVDRALGGEGHTFATTILHRDGPRHVNVTYIPDRAPDGVVLGYVAVITDVHEQRQLVIEL